MLKEIYNQIRLIISNIRFRKKNKHNDITLLSNYPIDNICVGICSYGKLNIKAYNKKGKIKIGNYCSIADKVEFLIGGEHNYKKISTYPFQSKIYKQDSTHCPNYDIVIDDDVWIGYDCLIMSNSHIGKGSVIGARSIVKGNIPPYSIYIGNKVYKQRFSDDIMKKISKIDFSKVKHTLSDEYSKYCQNEVTDKNVNEIIKTFIK